MEELNMTEESVKGSTPEALVTPVARVVPYAPGIYYFSGNKRKQYFGSVLF